MCPECREKASPGFVTRLFMKFASVPRDNNCNGGSSSTDDAVSSSQETLNWIEKCHSKDLKCQELQRALEELRVLEEKHTADIAGHADTTNNYRAANEQLKKDIRNVKENERLMQNHRRQLEKQRDDAKKELEILRKSNFELHGYVPTVDRPIVRLIVRLTDCALFVWWTSLLIIFLQLDFFTALRLWFPGPLTRPRLFWLSGAMWGKGIPALCYTVLLLAPVYWNGKERENFHPVFF